MTKAPLAASWLQPWPVLQQCREVGSDFQMWLVGRLFPQSSDNGRKKGRSTAVILENGMKGRGISNWLS